MQQIHSQCRGDSIRHVESLPCHCGKSCGLQWNVASIHRFVSYCYFGASLSPIRCLNPKLKSGAGCYHERRLFRESRRGIQIPF